MNHYSDKYFQVKSRAVAIIGGGPAGCATGIALLQYLRNENLEDVDVCIFSDEKIAAVQIGESIPPDATPILHALNLEHTIEGNKHQVCPGSQSLWGSDLPSYNDFMLNPVGNGYHLDRKKFDCSLQEAFVNQGGRFFTSHRLRQLEESDDSFALSFNHQDKIERIKAHYVVDATGKSASFCRRLGVTRNVFDEVVSLSLLPKIPENRKISDFTFLEAVESGWWYAAKLPNQQMIISFHSDMEGIAENNLKDPRQWLKGLQETKWLKHQIPMDLLSGKSLDDLHIRVSPSSILSRVIGDNYLAVGDAASCYDSITSAGITKALMTGRQAGQAIGKQLSYQCHLAVEKYQQDIFQQFNRYVGLRSALYQSETRFSEFPFWQRRLGYS